MQTIIFTSNEVDGFGDNTAYIEVTPDGNSFRMGMKDGRVTYWLSEDCLDYDEYDRGWLAFGMSMVAKGKWAQSPGTEYVANPDYFAHISPQLARKMFAN